MWSESETPPVVRLIPLDDRLVFPGEVVALRVTRVVADALRTDVRPGGGVQGDLLRLEWPQHPRAQEYQIRFRDSGGSGPAPVTVSGTVFLYDMKSNALRLPEKFTWEVSAVLPDGSEIVTPRQGFAE